MEPEKLREVIGQLEDLNYCIMSGYAVKIYADPERECGDIDLIVEHEDLYKLAERLGTKVERRIEDYGSYGINDYGFETKYKGVEVEASSGFPRERFKEGKMEKVLDSKVEKEFRGVNVYVEPLEELVVHKANNDRKKDWRDIEKLSKKDIDKELLKEFAEDWGRPEVLEKLEEKGYWL